MEEKAKALGSIIGLLFGTAIGFLIAWIFDINPLKEYGWFMGWLHGAWALFNWVMSLFNDAVFVKAPLHTSAYNVFWWIGLVFTVWTEIKLLLSAIVSFRILFRKDY